MNSKNNIIALFSLLLVLLTANIDLFANDKNGVAPTTISLPSGPGSIEGLGLSFEPQLNTGSAVYNLQVKLPQGTSSHTPELHINYNSGTGDSPVGIGWNFGPSSISRKTDRGLPRYVDSDNSSDDDKDGLVDELDEIDLFVYGRDDLVADSSGFYRSRIEKDFYRFQKIGDYWEARGKDGSKKIFGQSQSSRVTDATGTRIFKWMLETFIDKNGNEIQYTYTSFPGSDNQKYLSKIRYGAGAGGWNTFYFVALSYENRPDWRQDFRSGFQIITAHRLSQIDVGVQGVTNPGALTGDLNNDGQSDSLIRRYRLTYGTGGDDGLYLNTVTMLGADGVTKLPPINFDYIFFNPGESIPATDGMIGTTNPPANVMDNNSTEIIDFNNDGLPDILYTDGFQQSVTLNMGPEETGGEKVIRWSTGQVVSDLSIDLASDNVSLMDMNGDGLADLTIKSIISEEIYYYPNLGTMGWGEQQYMSFSGPEAPPAPGSSADVVTLDMDFDKRIDIVQSDDFGYNIWFNLGDNTYSKKVRTDGAFHSGDSSVLRFSDTFVRRADLNGDRLLDVVRLGESSMVFIPNQGYGSFADSVVIPMPDNWLIGHSELVQEAQLHDINGDGLADLVIERPEIHELWYWVNQGTNQFGTRRVITDLPALYGPNITMRWADMNGNGTTDLIYSDSAADDKLLLLDIGVLEELPGPPNVLQKIDNGLGILTEIVYRSSAEFYVEARESGTPWSSTIPFNVAVIARKIITTGLDVDTNAGPDQYVIDYSYADPFYDINEKAFRGFALANVKDLGDASAPAGMTTYRFFTGGPDGLDNDDDGQIDERSPEGFREEEPLTGLVQEIETRSESGTLYHIDQNSWKIRTLLTSPDGREVRWAFNKSERSRVFEGTATPEETLIEYEYDDYGNIIREYKHGILSFTGDEEFKETTYITDTERWILNYPQTETVSDKDSIKQKETFYYYDGADFVGLALGAIDKGNLSRVSGWVKDTDYIDIKRIAYDSYGNPSILMDGEGNLRHIEWDTHFSAYPITETIETQDGAPDLVTSVNYNYAFGTVDQVTDFNGNITAYYYDKIGRPTSVVKPGDSNTFPTQVFSYEIADPQKSLLYRYDREGNLDLITSSPRPSAVIVKTREVSGESGTYDVIQYVDGRGRKLALVSESEEGYTVKDAVILNSKGDPRYRYKPYFTNSKEYVRPNAGLARIETRYDAIERAIQTIYPETAIGISSRFTSYAPFQTTFTDENGHVKTHHYDGREKLIQFDEHNQGETYTTSYQYDTLANLIQITDAQNNVKTIVYDGLSRTTAVNDLDKGTTQYVYDDAGRIIQSTDNKNQVIEYTYDKAGRTLSEDYLDTQAISPDVTMHYDRPSSEYPLATQTKAKLSWVEDLSGGIFYSYDEKGNIVWQVKRIQDGSSDTTDYLTGFSYDALDRATQMTYPDGSRVSYQYSKGNQLDAIPDYIENIDYEADGNIKHITYQNKVQTDYQFDARLRPTRLTTTLLNDSHNPLQDLSYLFDGVGNINAITDGRNLAPGSLRSATQSFQYDDLDRLTHASGAYGEISYQYDKIGNMTQKGSPESGMPGHVKDELINLGIMSYGGTGGKSDRTPRVPGDAPGPHAITSTASGLAYEYDDNGNMISHAQGDIYQWDFKNRLTGVQNESSDASYVYDVNNQRVIKKVNNSTGEKTSYYVSKYYEIRDGEAIKYVFAGDRRIARVSDNPPISAPQDLKQQKILLQPGWNFFSLTVAPEDSTVATILAPIAGKYSEVMGFDPESQIYQHFVPGAPDNTLNEFIPGRGYLIEVTELTTLKLTGIQADKTISLLSGWNLTSIQICSPTKPIVALGSIADKIRSIWHHNSVSDQWELYDTDSASPEFLNTMQTIDPNKVYWIEVNGDASTQPEENLANRVIFYHIDHLNSSNVMTNLEGKVVENIEYYPFGRPRSIDAYGFDSPYKYTGKELDNESDLMYYEARYYDPVIGRFISPDPLFADNPEEGIGDPGQSNLYSYVANNPLKYIDPTGQYAQEDGSGNQQESGNEKNEKTERDRDRDRGSDRDSSDSKSKSERDLGNEKEQTVVEETVVPDWDTSVTQKWVPKPKPEWQSKGAGGPMEEPTREELEDELEQMDECFNTMAKASIPVGGVASLGEAAALKMVAKAGQIGFGAVAVTAGTCWGRAEYIRNKLNE